MLSERSYLLTALACTGWLLWSSCILKRVASADGGAIACIHSHPYHQEPSSTTKFTWSMGCENLAVRRKATSGEMYECPVNAHRYYHFGHWCTQNLSYHLDSITENDPQWELRTMAESPGVTTRRLAPNTTSEHTMPYHCL
jgi:hypothetical protein